MTQSLTISTPFADVAELTDNFAQRVDEQRLMLPHAEPVADGTWVQFTVLLADGSSAMEGVGRVQSISDNGEDHPAEYRYDVVLEELQLEGMSEVLFERFLVAREAATNGGESTGEVQIAELQQQAQSAPAADDWDAGLDMAAAEEPSGEVEMADLDDAAEVDAEAEELEAAPSRPAPPAPPAAPKAPPPAAPYPTMAREPGKLPSPHVFNGRPLTRPTLPAAWSPEPTERPAAAQSSGLFDYEGGLPKPARPPRPELDASQVVRPAPRPGAPWPRQRASDAGAAPVIAAAVVAAPIAEEIVEEEDSAEIETGAAIEHEEW